MGNDYIQQDLNQLGLVTHDSLFNETHFIAKDPLNLPMQ